MKKMLLGIALILFGNCSSLAAVIGVAYYYIASVFALVGLVLCIKGYREM